MGEFMRHKLIIALSFGLLCGALFGAFSREAIAYIAVKKQPQSDMLLDQCLSRMQYNYVF